jgi:2-hydroxychromene-2-carboxylate isomerase
VATGVRGRSVKACGRTSWGLTERREAGIADCEARALAHGLGPIVWPDHWPTNDLLVARAMIVAAREGIVERFALAAMRLAFREGMDLSEPEAVGETARRSGMDHDRVDRLVDDPDVKAELRRATDRAVSLGVFGIPTVAIDGELFWATAASMTPRAAHARRDCG